MREHLRTGIGVCAIAAVVLAAPTAAGAAPTKSKNAELINIVCDNGLTGQIVTMGDGQWTPGHVVGSTTLGVPVAFGVSTFTAYDAAGGVVFTGTDPAQTGHANGRARQSDLVNCSYDSGLVNVAGQPDYPPGTVNVEFSGTVTVAIVANH